ncbi:MAG TPA: lamin tail domain-containing protein [Pyrinomonadaceae bacterium]|jgi:uncharacterized protein (TIGR03437 family)|nr:lamin tail domain-containing protein [Pyrinomonadaceae bacterium]
MPRHRSGRFFFVLIAAVVLCTANWQRARTQSPLRRLTNTAESAISSNPSISGDGRVVAFESTADLADTGSVEGFRAIRAQIETDHPSFSQIGLSRAPAPAVSEDGSCIAFAAKDNPSGANVDGNSEIFLYAGARLVQVTNTLPGDDASRVVNGNFQPSISDDGRFIAFSSNRNLTNQNADENFEIFIYDAVALTFTQLTDSAGIVGASDAKISGNGANVAYIRDRGTINRDLVLQNRVGTPTIRTLASDTPGLAMTYGRAISDDGERVVWSAQTATNTTQVFLFDGRNDNTIRQITALGSRSSDVPLHPGVSGDGSTISFATRRSVLGPGSNSDSSVELYSFDVPSGTLGRVTNVSDSGATAEVVSSLNDDGTLIAFNFPRLLSGPVTHDIYENNSEIYLSATPPRPVSGSLTILNRGSFGHEPSTTKAVAPDSIAAAFGGALAFATRQPQRQADGTFPTALGGTTVTVNDQTAQVLFVSPAEVHFHVPAATALGTAEVIVTNSDGFQSRGSISVLQAAPGVFTKSGDGLGEATILNADTLQPGPFDPTNANLRLMIFATGTRNGTTVSVTAAGRALTLESIINSNSLPGLDELHLLVPADLRGSGNVDLTIRADGRDSNPGEVEFSGDSRRDILINEFLADPPEGAAGDANRDGVRDSSQDEFVELVNTTTNDIDISGYRIFTRASGTGIATLRHLFPPGSVLPSCSAVVVFGGGGAAFNADDPAFGGALVLKASSGSLALVNSSGTLSLQDQNSEIVNLIAYGGTSSIDANDNQSVTRAPDLTGNFVQHLEASGGVRLFSPGTRISGAPFISCAPAVVRVEIAPSLASIDTGAQQQFDARAFDAGNNEVPGVIFSWRSDNTNAATIDQNGLANGLHPGSSEIRASGRGVQSPPAVLTVNAIAPPNVVINEVDSDQAGTDTAEFVEIYDGGAGNTSLNGLVLVCYNGADDKSYAAFDLDTQRTNPSGYFTLGNAAVPGVDQIFPDGAMQNGPDAIAIYVGNATDFPNGTPVTTNNLIDALVYDTNDADDPGLLTLLNSGQPQINEDDGGNGTLNSNQRCPNGFGGARNDSNYKQFAPTPDRANVCVAIAPPPSLTIADISLDEGNAGPTTFTFTVSLSSPAPLGGVSFDIATADNTATIADDDYVAKTLSAQTIPAGTQTYLFVVTVNGDTKVEPDEYFFVDVSNVSGATIGDGQGLATLRNDDSPLLSINDLSISEGNRGPAILSFTVTSSLPAPAGGISFDISTADGTANDGNPALEDNDYTSRLLTCQMISAGTTSYTFDVTVNGDTLVENDETFFVNLTNAVGATIGAGHGQGTIQNDDAPNLVISQLYAGGGNSAAQFSNDFVEIFNRGTTTVNFATTPFSVQYAGATANFGSSKVDLTSGTVFAGQYFLVKLSGGANGLPLPTPDATGAIAMAATAGKLALVFGTTALTGSGCPMSATVVDFVGYGTSASCFEGPGRTPAPGNTTAAIRKAGGCTDTNDNTADFFVSPPFPRNSSSPLNNCIAGAPPFMTINDVTVAEGDSGTTTATFIVSLSTPAPSTDITFDITTHDNSATTTNGDYVAKSLTTQIIPAGQQTYLFSVSVSGDAAVEPDETFFVDLTNVSGATLADSQGVGTIQNDDLPSLSINDVSQNETNAGSTIFTFTVSLSAPASTGGVKFDIATEDGTATVADSDYLPLTLSSQTIPEGSSTYSFAVTVNGDLAIEANETFFANVSHLSGATVADVQGVGTIQNDDSPALTITDVSQSETNSGDTTFTFTITSSLPAPASGITFDIATADGTAHDGVPPTEDNDYVSRSLIAQTIPAGATTYTFDVMVHGDTLVEPDETFVVNLSNVVNASVLDGQAVATIQNDDQPNVVISQVYGGGGNSTATYTNDFVELFNRGATTVDFSVTPYSVQYAAATSNFSTNKTDITSGILLPGHYFLIREASGGANGVGLPLPDVSTGTINLAATAGKVALVSGTAALSGSGCPLGATVADFLGYGSAANCAETTPITVSGTNSNARSVIRTSSCIDTNNNSVDFSNPTTAPVARNTATTPTACP